MRSVIGLLLVSVSSLTVVAEPSRPMSSGPIPSGTTIDIRLDRARSTPSAAVSSRLIYMHRCPPLGCTVREGADDSSTDHSSISQGTRTIGSFTQGDEVWALLMECMRTTYAPFDISVTDVDPGSAPHFENIVGGVPSELRNDIPNAGGVAPFSCTSTGQGAEIPNAMVYTFDVYGPQPAYLCWTSAQEVAHAFGLDHVTLQKDPMTYRQGDLPKRFQPEPGICGEAAPRPCKCTGTATQNSYLHIVGMFGPGVPTPPMLEIASPSAGKVVQPKFVVRVKATDDVAVERVELVIDGVATGASATSAPYDLVAPDGLAEGPHTVEVRAYDIQGTLGTAQVAVDLGPPCTAAAGCTATDVCVNGVCTAGPGVPGGLGDSCDLDRECFASRCAEDSTGDKRCVEACAGPGTCPNGFECLDGASVCWPVADAGCCSTGGDPTVPALLGLGVLALVLRRRTRHHVPRRP